MNPRLAVPLCAAWLAACAALAPAPPAPVVASPAVAEPAPAPIAAHAAAASAPARLLAGDEHLLIVVPAAGDTWATLAERWLGDASRDWEIAALNGSDAPRAGQPLLLPRRPVNPAGVSSQLEGGVRVGHLQTVAILCYHRLGATPPAGTTNAAVLPGWGRMSVPADRFAEQLGWLAANGYRVVRLADVAAFLAGQRALPPRSVVLTFDDGYESFHRLAWPLLRRHGFPATVFVYTDFVGAADALSWAQIRELAASGLVDVQAHSRSHANLTQRGADESDDAWRSRIEAEVRQPRELLARQLGRPAPAVRHYAYPYGDANEAVRAALQRHRYELGLTVTPGGTPFMAAPLMLRRTMIFGSHDLDDFRERLQVERAWTPAW